MIGSSLHRYKDNARYVGVDFEGESLNLRFARPFQISYCIADNKEIKDIRTSFILWKDINMSQDAARITRFNRDLYFATARPAEEVLTEFDAVTYDPNTEIVWQNGLGYDYYVHRNWRRLCGKPHDDSYLDRAIDLKALTQAMKKGWVPDMSSPLAFRAWQYRAASYVERGLKSNLETCGKEEKIDHDFSTLHDATSDIVLMMKIFWKRLYQVEF
jgi:hypothetical protein